MYKNLHYLQIGLGSMGKRRIRNLLFHGIPTDHIIGFDLSRERRREATKTYGISVAENFQEAIEQYKPEVLIISTPPHLHLKYCLFAAKHNLHFFVEISTTDTGYPTLIRQLKTRNIVAAPSCTYRFFTPILMMRNLIEKGKIGKVEAFLHHCGQYLPDWHPWESYQDFYVSKPESSALKEMFLYELCWISWLTNTQFTKIVGITEKVTGLDMKIPDVYGAYVTSKNHVVGNIFIDLISRHPFRTIRVLGSEGTMEWHLNKHTIELYRSKTKKMETITVPSGKKRSEYALADETMYEEEMRAFLHAIDGKRSFPYTFAEDQQYFRLLSELERNQRSLHSK